MATIKAVAERAGVSVTTVSHALNRPERVTPELRERVTRAAAELGYQPNPIARSLRTGRTGLVAMIIPDICNPFFPEVTRAAQDELATAGFDTVIYNTDVPAGMAPTYLGHYLRQLAPKRFDGAIIADPATLDTEGVFERLMVPGVYIGHPFPSVIDYVAVDEYAIGYEATSYLIGRGHRRVAHITGEPRFFSACERRRGYLAALADHGLPEDEQLIYPGTFLRAAGSAGIRRLLSLDRPPTAVFVASDVMAIAALGTAYDLGLRVPDDLAIIGVDNIQESSDVRPMLTTVDHNGRTLGRVSAQLLLRRLGGEKPAQPEAVIVPHQIVERASA